MGLQTGPFRIPCEAQPRDTAASPRPGGRRPGPRTPGDGGRAGHPRHGLLPCRDVGRGSSSAPRPPAPGFCREAPEVPLPRRGRREGRDVSRAAIDARTEPGCAGKSPTEKPEEPSKITGSGAAERRFRSTHLMAHGEIPRGTRDDDHGKFLRGLPVRGRASSATSRSGVPVTTIPERLRRRNGLL